MNFEHKKIIFLICLGNVAISFNIGAVAAALPDISAALGVSEFAAARLVPFYMIPYGLGALLYAPLTRFWTYRRCLMFAMATYAVASLVSGCGRSLSAILLAQTVAGIAAASSTPLSLMIIGDFFERDVRGRLVGTYFGCSFFATMVGMFFMGAVDWRWLFFIPSMIAAVNCLSLWLLKIPQLSSRHTQSVNYWTALNKDHIRPVFLFIFAMSFLYHAVHKWYGIYLNQEYGLGKQAISAILILVAVCGLAGQHIGGHLSDKKGRLAACYAGLAGLSLGVALLVGHYPLLLLTAVLGLIGISWTMSHNSVSTILTDFPDEDRPVIASLNSAVRFVSGGIGFSLSKYFVEKSFGLTFLGIGVLFFLMLFSVKHVFPRRS
jgi:predicted MFS family arabinose efflux permease